MSTGASPGPDGLRIRQTRDATVIRVFPYAPSRPWPELVGSVGALVLWGGLRVALPDLLWVRGGLGLGALLLLVTLGARALRGLRRGQEVLEVYVGKRHLELVFSRDGEALRRETLELVRLEDAESGDGEVTLLVEGGEPIQLPMQRHSDEARGWMVEHMRGAGLGARRRFGHLPLVGDARGSGNTADGQRATPCPPRQRGANVVSPGDAVD